MVGAQGVLLAFGHLVEAGHPGGLGGVAQRVGQAVVDGVAPDLGDLRHVGGAALAALDLDGGDVGKVLGASIEPGSTVIVERLKEEIKGGPDDGLEVSVKIVKPKKSRAKKKAPAAVGAKSETDSESDAPEPADDADAAAPDEQGDDEG